MGNRTTVQVQEDKGQPSKGRPTPFDGETLKILILNLMPNKIETEKQFKRLLVDSNPGIELSFMRTESYASKNTSGEYLKNHYKTLSDVSSEKYDGFICTGSPVETFPFHEVNYWGELLKIFDWVEKNKIPSYYICWAGQALLNHRYKIEKFLLPQKQFGVYSHQLQNLSNPLVQGLPKHIPIPVSRYTGVNREDIEAVSDLEILLDSPEAGLCLIANKRYNEYYNFNHFEYDTLTLADEYSRDLNRGEDVPLPANYFPGDDPQNSPVNTWNENAESVFNNWIKIIEEHRFNHD